jgi:hypothetical protein
MSIDTYLTHLVDIVAVTISKGERTEVTTEDVPARITSRREVVHDSRGDRLASKTVVYLKPDQTITGQDEIIVDSQQRAIAAIVRARDAVDIHHLEVTLQ